MYRKYFVYLDDGNEVYKVAIPAVCEETAKALCAGNGEVVAVKDVTDDYPISLAKVRNALQNAAFGGVEMDFIFRILSEMGIAE